MIKPLFDRVFVERHGFQDTLLYRKLRAEPIILADVGARWGPPPIFEALAEVFHVEAFEPDREAAHDQHAANLAGGWAKFVTHPFALGAASINLTRSRSRSITIHRTARPNNSSMYPPNQALIEKYQLPGFAVVDTFATRVEVLDQVLDRAEVLKIDVQGAELEVLRGASRNLARHVQCAIIEADLWPLYVGAPLFFEVERKMRAYDFAFHDFRDVHRHQERLTHADAIFFNDRPRLNERALLIQAVMALLLGFNTLFHASISALCWSDADTAPLLHFAEKVNDQADG